MVIINYSNNEYLKVRIRGVKNGCVNKGNKKQITLKMAYAILKR